MRKKKILLMGTLLFMCWCTIQLYLFVHKPQSQLLKSALPWFIRGKSDNLNANNSKMNGDNDQFLSFISFNSRKQSKHDQNSQNINVNLAVKSGVNSANIEYGGKMIELNHSNSDQIDNNNSIETTTTANSINFDLISNKIEHLEIDLNEQTKTNEIMLRLLNNINKLSNIMNKTIIDIINNKTLIQSLLNPPVKQEPVICVLLFACNRITVKRNLDQLFKYRNNSQIFPIVVSQDCNHEKTRQIIESYGNRLTFIQQPDQSDIILKGKNQKKFKGYYKISRHYGWALNYTFNQLNYDTVLIVEDDLDIAPDFFEYFLALYPLLHSDPSLYCISAWNDNGKRSLIENDPAKLYRSDFFPGLGWMLTKDLWLEFQHKWPKAFWDDWIRQPEQRRNRACIRPEISRTSTFGKKGVSNGLFFEKHLKFIHLNDKYVPFTKMNLSYLLKENYDVEFIKQVYNSRLLSLYDVKSLPKLNDDRQSSINVHDDHHVNNDNQTKSSTLLANKYSIRIQYDTRDQFKKAAKLFGLMDDFKSGVPRTGYQGTVGFMYHGYRIYLAPSPIWNGYNVTWK